MPTNTTKEDEIADSTDWLSTPLPKLSAVESALRCQVCKEFFRTPMITSCSHTFCSICIRRCLNNDNRCPACRAEDQELKLRSNWAMEEMVDAFTKARPEILEFASRPMEPGSPKRKRSAVEPVEENPRRKRTRSSGRTLRSPQPLEITILDSEEDNDGDYEPRDGLVACPICSDRMTEKAVQLHIDSCNGIPPSKKPAPVVARRSMIDPPTSITKPIKSLEKLAHPHFSMLKDVQLRKKLTDQGLSAGGNRKAQEDRLKEWVLLWNSNCDNKVPRSRADLRRDLDTWERTQGDRASTSNIAYATGLQIKDKDFDAKAWSDQHSDSFGDLIAKAKSKAAAKRKAAEETEDSGASNPSAQNPPNPELQIDAPSVKSMKPPPRTPLPTEPDPNPPEILPAPQMLSLNYNSEPGRFFHDSVIDSSIPPPSRQYDGLPQDMDNEC